MAIANITNNILTDSGVATSSLQIALNGTGFVKISGTTISYDNSTYYLASNPSAFISLTALSAGVGISYNNTTGVITNSAPDQTVALTASTGISVTGTYPNFTITNTSPSSGGTVTSVAALTIGTSGTDLSSTVANSTTTPVITLNVPTASATNRGVLASADWTTFNNKQNALTNPVTGTGTTNYLPKFTGTSTIGDSTMQDDGTNVSITGGFTANSFLRVFKNGSDSLGSGPFMALYNAGATAAIFQQLNASNGLDWWTTFGKLMTLTASGNLGLGVTPSAWSIVTPIMQIGTGGGFIGGQGSANVIRVGVNTYFNGSNWIYINSDYASWFETGSGAFKWYNAPSGTAGGVVTTTQAMTLTASGNLGVGIAAPTERLHIYSSASSTEIRIENSTTSAYIRSQTDNLNFYFNGAERMRITSGGNVLIGTTTASTGISSNDLLTIGKSGSTSNALIFSNGSTTNWGYLLAESGKMVLGSGSSSNITFETNAGSERMRIGSNGLVGVGTYNSTGIAGDVIMYVKNSAAGDGIISNVNANNRSSAVFIGYSASASSYTSYIYSNGGAYFASNVLIGTTDDGSGSKVLSYSTTAATQFKAAGTAPAITFTNTITGASYGGVLGACTSANQFISGTSAGDMVLANQFSGYRLYAVSYSGGVYLTSGATSWTANSDIRLKNINSHIENAVEKLSTLQTINFSYKDDKTKKQNLGLIAQEVEKIFPELIDKNGDGMLGVRYTELVPVLIKAVQELKLEIETLKNK